MLLSAVAFSFCDLSLSFAYFSDLSMSFAEFGDFSVGDGMSLLGLVLATICVECCRLALSGFYDFSLSATLLSA